MRNEIERLHYLADPRNMTIRASDMNPFINVLEVENARTDLLAWAGLHRGKDISESIMPRFHEIIDRLDQALGH